MTGDELKAWREARGLSQSELADLLGDTWSRDMVANREAGRATMPENIRHKLALLDDELAARKSEPKKPRLEYSDFKCWTLQGQPIAFLDVLKKPVGFQFYRLDSPDDIDPVTNHLKANLYETTRKFRRGQCTYFALDLETWRVHCLAWPDHPAHVAALPKLQALLTPQKEQS